MHHLVAGYRPTRLACQMDLLLIKRNLFHDMLFYRTFVICLQNANLVLRIPLFAPRARIRLQLRTHADVNIIPVRTKVSAE